MLQIPNIYAGDYKRLIVIPFFFLAISAYLVLVSPGIPAGIDLRGGILITLQTPSTVNADALKQSLISELGVHDASVKTAPGPLGGTAVEIEIEQHAKLADAERALTQFYTQYNLFVTQDYDVTSISNYLTRANLTDDDKAKSQAQLADATVKRDAAEAAMDSQADTVFASTASFMPGVSRANATSATQLRDLVASTYANAGNVYRDKVLGILRSHMRVTDFSYKDVSPSLSEFFLQKTYQVVIFSLLLSAVAVVLVFRTFIPSLAVMFGAVNDITFALGAMALFQIPLTLASLGALLMLIGFSLDTDMLVSIRVLKRVEGNARDRAYSAMKTGLTMSVAALLAFAVLYVLSVVTQLPTYSQIAAIALAGLVGDVIATWCTDAVMVLWYYESKQKRVAR